MRYQKAVDKRFLPWSACRMCPRAARMHGACVPGWFLGQIGTAR